MPKTTTKTKRSGTARSVSSKKMKGTKGGIVLFANKPRAMSGGTNSSIGRIVTDGETFPRSPRPK